jgi:hypothetical protein
MVCRVVVATPSMVSVLRGDPDRGLVALRV